MATMRSISIISIGHKTPDWIQTGCDYYYKMLLQHHKVQLQHINAVSTKLDPKQREIKESEAIKSKIPAGSFIITMDEKGKEFSSNKFATFMNNTYDNFSKITFIIGPSDGLSDEIKQLSNASIALSKLTFTHDLAKLLLLEGLYRCQCITSGHPYHRD